MNRVLDRQETERLGALRELDILGTAPEPDFDAVCSLAALSFGVPTSLISLIEEDHQWFKARCGFEAEGTPRDISFCSWAIASDDILVVEDAKRDERFAANPLVVGDPNIRFYAGAPLVLRPNVRVGTICLIDIAPRRFTAEDHRKLGEFATIVVALLRLRESNARQQREIAARVASEALVKTQARDLIEREAALRESNRLLLMAEEMTNAGHWRFDVSARRRVWSPEVYRIFGFEPGTPAPVLDVDGNGYHPDDQDRVRAIVAEAIAKRSPFSFEARAQRPDGSIRCVSVRGICETGADDAVRSLFGVIIDVTDGKRIEERLKARENELTAVLDNMPALIGYLDRDLRVRLANKTYSDWYGRAAADISGWHIRDVLGEKTYRLNLPQMKAALRGERQSFERRLPARAGGRYGFASYIPDVQQGDVKGFFILIMDITERKRVEDDLRASMAFQDRAGRIAGVGAWDLDLVSDMVTFSQETLRVLEIETGCRLERDRFLDFYAPEVRFRMSQALADSIDLGRPFDLELPLITAKGRSIWVRTAGEAEVIDGEPTRLFGVLQDVNLRRQAEDRLQASETLYRTLADSLPQMIWIVRAGDRTATYVNRQFEHFYGSIGTTRDERVGRSHPDDVDHMEATWALAAAERRTFEVEGRLRRRDGHYRWHKVIATPLFRGNDIDEWLGTALDIDDIITGRQKLRETSDLLSLSQEAAGAGSFDINFDTGMAMLSRESAVMHGFESQTAIVIDLSEWQSRVDPEDGARALRLVAEACSTGQTYSAEFRVFSLAGACRWIHGIGRAQYDSAGKATRMFGLNFDVTDRKTSEAKLVEAMAAAESARRDAEQASAAKSEFLATVSHEIRTPLNSIIGYTDLLLDKPHRDEDDRRKLELIQASGSSLLTIVNDILDFSKIEAGQVELDAVPFSPVALIDNVMSMVIGFASKTVLSIRSEIAPDLPERVVGDANRLRQILLNLLNNAVKFTSQGTVTLHVACQSQAPALCRLRFVVADTGIGISSDRRDRLFQRFSQMDGSIGRRYGGTGLGLAISKKLVELMGGAIGVDSLEGKGSSFWFEIALPIAASSHDLLDPEPDEENGRPQPARILLVEDIIVNQDLARLILEAQGHIVETASDGVEAVQKVQAGAFDLVLMDVQMPGMDGLTATSCIRAMDQPCRTIPIVAMTANVLPQQVAAFKAAGMDDHIGKPFKRAELYAAIRRWGPKASKRVKDLPRSSCLDPHILDDLRDMVGETLCRRLIAKFAQEVDQRFDLSPSAVDRSRLASEAHAMIASAGSLGFTRFSDLCREVETICRAGGDLTDCVARLLAARHGVLAEIATLSPPS